MEINERNSGMVLNVRKLKADDFPVLHKMMSGDEKALGQLGELQTKREKGGHSGFPDSVIVALEDDVIVGYQHWYTDCWEGYEIVPVGSNVLSSLSSETQKDVQNLLADHAKEVQADEF